MRSDLRFLIDQDVSPTHVARLAGLGFFAEHVAYVGMSGRADSDVLAFAYERSSIIITKNVVDFVRLAHLATLHPGMILLRDGMLTRLVEWAWIEPVVLHLRDATVDPMDTVVDVTGPGTFQVSELPAL